MQKQGKHWRDWLADHMEISEEHKQSLYLDISQGATLLKMNYWLELLSAAGIATLGLALNSPAVIIGAMLISPLMSPILSMGLSLASGDFILAIRSIISLLLSAFISILLATTLVYLLPFKEVTSEIAGRTNPNLLDLVVALFSGAIGSISTCKPMKGIVNSIPGVAIAVALMPPLCVVGHGLAIAISTNLTQGIRVSTGGLLLFITNLVAISFTAMLVFLCLHIDTESVKEKVREWNSNDTESKVIQSFLNKNQFLQRLRPIGSLYGRLLMILSVVFLLIFPLTESINRLSLEISNRNEENRIRRVAKTVWDQQIAQYPDGKIRSYINQLSIQRRNEEVVLNLSAFTSQPLSLQERQQYIEKVANSLNQPVEKVLLNLIEVPTSQARDSGLELLTSEQSLGELHSQFAGRMEQIIKSITLPEGKKLVGYKIISDPNLRLTIQVTYIADTAISEDAAALIVTNLIKSIPLVDVKANLEFLDGGFRPLSVNKNSGDLLPEQTKKELDRLGQSLNDFPILLLEIWSPLEEVSGQEVKAISKYLEENHQIQSNRIIFQTQGAQTLKARLKLN